MLETPIISIGNPGTFDITDKTNPQYYIARYSHEMSKNLWELASDGFVWRQAENSDFSALISSFDTYADDLETWFTSAVAASNDDLPIPAPPSIPALPGSSLPGILLSLLFRIVIRILVDWLRKKLDPTTEALEIARILKEGLLGENAASESYSLIEKLAALPIRITVSKADEFQSAIFQNPVVEE